MTFGGAPEGPPPRFGGGADQRPERKELLAAAVRWPDPALLVRPLTSVPGVGEKFSAQAAEAGVETVGDLLWRVPRAYGTAARHQPAG